MTTDVERYMPPGELVAAPAVDTDLVTWANAVREIHVVAKQLAETSFVPKSMSHKPSDVTGCILAGRELGMSPMSSLRSIDLIQGVPSMRAHALRGLVQSHGHDVWVEDSTETRAIVCGKRRGSEHVERSVWTIDRARKAGLANKETWRNHPTAMLIARATSEVCRLIAADVLLGMPYSVEELRDDDDAALVEPAGVEAPAKPKAARRTAQRAPAPEPPSVPEPVDEPAAAAPAAPVPAPSFDEPADEPFPVDGITPAQVTRLQIAYRDIGLTDRADRLRHASNIVGRNVPSANDLTRNEASRLIDALAAAAGQLDDDDAPDDHDPDVPMVDVELPEVDQ